jgi:hypothetical protein
MMEFRGIGRSVPVFLSYEQRFSAAYRTGRELSDLGLWREINLQINLLIGFQYPLSHDRLRQVLQIWQTYPAAGVYAFGRAVTESARQSP